ncbi:hypothetical protein WN944_018653 [Citrus x changshan-huyou]|uniref:Uncharacterized protein n=1 Tax=Citrus x changshan-huyou TaxID=2935761 RepID=A0AAP0LUT0_9ROSI
MLAEAPASPGDGSHESGKQSPRSNIHKDDSPGPGSGYSNLVKPITGPRYIRVLEKASRFCTFIHPDLGSTCAESSRSGLDSEKFAIPKPEISWVHEYYKLVNPNEHLSLSLLSTYPISGRHVGSTTTHRLPISPRVFRGSISFWPARVSLAPQTLRFRVSAAAGLGHLLHDAGATAAVLVGAYGLVLSFDNLSQRKLIQPVH